MTAQDREAINEMVVAALNGLSGRFDLIEYKLSEASVKLNEIKEQTTKTNGRVNKLEERELLHTQNCPLTVRIEKLEDAKKETTSINKWLLRGFGILVSLVGAFWAVVQIVTKIS